MTHPDSAASETSGLEIAIIGMAGRFSTAANIDALWNVLSTGGEALREVTEAELDAAGVPSDVRSAPAYVRRRGVLARKLVFDAELFGYSAGAAAQMEPQFAVFHELAWEALEHAGYHSGKYAGQIGVYGGASSPDAWLARVLGARLSMADQYSLASLTKTGYLSTRVAHKLDLTGPALTLNTTCSTSLVAIHAACQALLTGDCDMALAGGVTASIDTQGYLYQENMVMSPDGACRPFDAAAAGTVSGEGGGVLVLKRLDDARAANDSILAVIKGSAVNNDGQRKVGYTAPGIEGQARVIRSALARAEVAPDSIGYVEAHGTGTALGDPIELAALQQVFDGVAPASCPIGSVKATIGHLSEGAGVAGVIKAILALQHETIPPNPYFTAPNPLLNMEAGAFFVNRAALAWPRGAQPRRAAVSSFGIGGTNAHVIVEEAPAPPVSAAGRAAALICLSAQSPTALAALERRLGDYAAAQLAAPQPVELADIAYTLHVGRKDLPYRKAYPVASLAELARLAGPARPATDGDHGAAQGKADKTAPRLAFLFPGQGAQYAGMGRALYESEPLFRATLEHCFAIAGQLGAGDLAALLYPGPAAGAAAAPLVATGAVQPLLFSFEYALATLLAQWGCRAHAYLGHSVGEYVAACLAGVFTLEDALAVVVARGRLMQSLPPGAMLAVSAGSAVLAPLLGADVSVAAINSPQRTVVAGDAIAIGALRAQLAARDIDSVVLDTSHAFHSHHIEPVLARFEAIVAGVRLQAPHTPFLSNVSGTWIAAGEATSPAYWARQMRAPVRFADCIATLCAQEPHLLVEVGPGAALSHFALQCGAAHPRQAVALVASAARAAQRAGLTVLFDGLARLYVGGAAFDWPALYAGQRRRRVALPAYPFEGRCHYPAHMLQREAGARPEAAGPGAPAAAMPTPPTPPTPPAQPVAAALLAVWRTFLATDTLGATDDLFDFGVDSLMSIRVIAEIRATFDVDLALDAMFAHRTVAAQAAEILRLQGQRAAAAAHGGADSAASAAPAPAARADAAPLTLGPAPLSPGQKRMWVVAQLERERTAYNVGFHHLMHGLDVDVLRRVLHRVVARHTILRTRYIDIDGEPMQEIRTTFEVPVTIIDIAAAPGAQRHLAAEQLWHATLLRPISLRDDLMLRVAVARFDDDTQLLMVVQHHICSDNWSLNLLVQEIDVLYRAFLAGQPDPLPPLALQYIDYAQRQLAALDGGVLARQLPYWTDALAGIAPVHGLPLDFARPAYQSFRGTVHASQVDAATVNGLNRLALQHGATLFMAMQAAYAAFLSRYSGATDILVGFPMANRGGRDLEPMIGFFVNTLVLRSDLTGAPSFARLLGQTRQRLLAAYANQDVPFELLVETLRPVRSLGHEPVVQLMLVYLDQSQGEGGRGSAFARGADAAADAAAAGQLKRPFSKYDLTLYFSVVDGALALTWEYATDLFKPATVARMADNFAAFLRAIVAAPDQALPQLALLAPADLARQREYGNVSAAAAAAAAAAAVVTAVATADAEADAAAAAEAHFNFSLFYFASDDGACGGDKYRLLTDGARFADRAGFEAVWTPERHLDAFGGAYPNPALTAALLAGITERVHLRAGSCVLPLHHPVRVAEDWSVVDNMSGGRIGIGVAAGFSTRDFTLAPARFDDRRQLMRDNLALVRALWRGDAVTLPDGKGEPHAVQIRPRPLQHELPVWVTTIGNEEAFRQAGRAGDNILTHLMGQSLDDLAAKIRVYRDERQAAGHAGAGKVTLLVHTFVAESDAVIVAHVKQAFKQYLIDSVGTPQAILAMLGGGAAQGQADVDAVAEQAFARYRRSKALFGTPEQCLPLVAAIRAAGVTELACLIDFGVAPQMVLDALPRLEQLRQLALAAPARAPVARSATSPVAAPATGLATGPTAHSSTAAAQAGPMFAQLFERQVERTPHAPAVIDGAVCLDYASLNARANRLAHALTGRYGVGPEQRVGLYLARGAEFLAGALAILKAGAACVPLVPGAHAGALAQQVAAAGVALVVTDQARRTCLDGLACTAIVPEGGPDDPTNPAGAPAAGHAAWVAADGGAYIVFEQRNLVALWSALAASVLDGCPAPARFAFATAPDAVASLRALVQLLSGHTLVVAPPSCGVPGAPQAFAAGAALDVIDGAALAQAGDRAHALVAGRVLDDADAAASAPGAVDRYQLYGPAGCTGAALWRAGAPATCGAGASDLGRPLAPVQVLLLDGHGQPVPLGLSGEIHLGGDLVARGYLDGDDPEDSAARNAAFIAAPVDAGAARWFRTGELGYWSDAGTLVRTGPDLRPDQAYWRAQLAGAPTLLSLPTDRPRPAQPGGVAACHDFALDPALWRRIVEHAASTGDATVPMVLAAAFALLLRRYSGQDDLCIATPLAGGHALVLRARIDGAAGFDALLAQVRLVWRAAQRHRRMTFAQLLATLGIVPGASHAPLSQAMFAAHDAALGPFDLACTVTATGAAAQGRFHYRADLFEAATIARMARHFVALLDGALAQADARTGAAVDDLPLLTPDDTARIVGAWNDTATPAAPVAAIQHLFEAQVARQPHAVALACAGSTWTYGALNGRANRLAHALRGLGAAPGVLVGICLERSADLVVAMLATLKAGAAYVPLDPAYPAVRLAFMLEDAAPGVVLTQAHLRARLGAFGGHCLALDADWDARVAPQPDTDPAPANGPADLAYVIYTSGSTGQPKGVMIEHRNVLNFIGWSLGHFSAAQLARTVLATSINFDLAVFETFVPLCAGATVVMVQNVLAFEPAAAGGATLLNTVPSAMAALLDTGRPLAPLRALNLAGEVLSEALCARIFATGAVDAIENLYGPTETTTYSTRARIVRGQPFVAHIGRPIANTRVYILDPQGRVQPVGVAGDIWIGGAGVARGYLNRPELTQQRFRADPFGPAGGRMYRTGDLGRFLEDGDIAYLGRCDDQVKLRGLRIEPGEVEAALLADGAVAAAAVAVRPDAHGEALLAAWVVMRDAAPERDLDAVRARLALALPAYMVPSVWVALAALPRTPNGKIDRQALPALPHGRRVRQRYVAPGSAAQSRVAAIVGGVLGVDQVGTDDNFFDLGGHSLKAVQLIGQLQRAFGVELPLRDVFECPTVAQLAALLERPALVQAPAGTLAPATADALEETEF